MSVYGTLGDSELEVLALDEKDAFLHGLCRRHLESCDRERAASAKVGGQVFAVLMLLVAEVFTEHALPGSSLLASIRNVAGDYMWALWALVGLVMFATFRFTWFKKRDEGWIYYPPLHDAIQQRREEEMRQRLLLVPAPIAAPKRRDSE